jgi:starch synthase
MYIVQIASEIAPAAKVGGLADVMMGLSRELKWKGNKVDILLPKYGCLLENHLSLKKSKNSFLSYFEGGWHENNLWTSPLAHDLMLTFIDPKHPKNFFNRSKIYGFADDIERFLYFSRACLDYLKGLKQVPDIIHLHDWESAPIAFLIRDKEFQNHFKKTKVVLTIHNMEYQGHTSEDALRLIGYNGPLDHIREGEGGANLLKGGMYAADAIVTVSPSYAKEVLTQEGAKGLLEPLLENKHKFSGILNGLDYTYWNPEVDGFLEHHFSYSSLPGKVANKEAVRRQLGLSEKSAPLIVSITRLVPQKGLELLKYTLKRVQEIGAQFILLGTTYDPDTEQQFSSLEKLYQHHPDVRISLQSEEGLAHQLYAASDMFIVPSIFEPCGLTQMIAMRYGSVPIVRLTGGLADTVYDVDHPEKSEEETNGFTFVHPDSGGVDFALRRAVNLFNSDKKRWKCLQKRGMCIDFSWNKPAEQYLALYRHLVA